MKKYNIKENRPELTKTEIEQGMNFKKINSKITSSAKIFSIKKIFLIGIAASVIISLSIFWPEKIGNEGIQFPNEVVQLPAKVNPPDTFLVNSEKDTTLIYESGTQIKIPAGAFVDEYGNEVKGKVKINYNEFHNVGEILLSAIPMTYDSGGKKMYFESAGMFDISANQNEKEVFIKKDKSLTVSMATLDVTKKKYNKYYLDEKTKQWQFIDKDEPVIVTNPDSVRKAKTDTCIALKPPVRPLNERMFTIDATGRPDLEIYNNIVFEITKDCKNFNSEEAKTDWGMVNIEKVEKTDKYKVTFSYPMSGPQRTYQVTARPLKDGNMDVAMKKYEALYSSYKQKLTEQEKKDLEIQEVLNKERNTYENVFKNYLSLQQKNAELYARQAMRTGEMAQVMCRTFQIKKFGIWNSDCPQSMPQGVEVFAKFETVDGNKVNVAAVYLVEKGKNALYNLYVPSKLSFNPEAENILLVITGEGKLGWVKNNIFESIGKEAKNFTFKLNILEKERYTSADIDSIVI